jgi:hypothetical protein
MAAVTEVAGRRAAEGVSRRRGAPAADPEDRLEKAVRAVGAEAGPAAVPAAARTRGVAAAGVVRGSLCVAKSNRCIYRGRFVSARARQTQNHMNASACGGSLAIPGNFAGEYWRAGSDRLLLRVVGSCSRRGARLLHPGAACGARGSDGRAALRVGTHAGWETGRLVLPRCAAAVKAKEYCSTEFPGMRRPVWGKVCDDTNLLR